MSGDRRSQMASLTALLQGAREHFPMIIVYDHPRDYPDHYVGRLWLSLPDPKPVNFVVRSRNIEDLREVMESAGLMKLMPQAGDDPIILETWL